IYGDGRDSAGSLAGGTGRERVWSRRRFLRAGWSFVSGDYGGQSCETAIGSGSKAGGSVCEPDGASAGGSDRPGERPGRENNGASDSESEPSRRLALVVCAA